MKKIPEKYLQIGAQGVDFAQQHFENQNITFVRTTKEEDIITGVDCYIDNIPVDVKNTKDLYICQIQKTSGMINVRHPYKSNSKATHFCFVQVTDKKHEFITLIEVRKKLLEFFDSEEKIDMFLADLQSIDRTHYTDYGVSIAQTCYKIKLSLQKHLNSSSFISYTEPQTDADEVSFCLKRKTPAKQQKTTSSDISQILDKFKNKSATQQKKDEIIKVKI